MEKSAEKPATSEKLAIVLLNLGGPAAEADIIPFLFNFFRDKNVITLPNPLRFLLAAWIAWSRGRGAAKKAYDHLGGRSLLLENTLAQATALEKELQKNNPAARVFVSMRHWHPLADEAVKQVAAFKPDKIVLLPLYPQYSTTTTLSALQDWHRAAHQAGLQVPIGDICCYPVDPGFIKASVTLIREELKKAPKKVRLLFSAHGLPKKMISAGDPYQQQCEQTAAAIVQQLNKPTLDWQICYQSRVGPLEWIGPSIKDALEKVSDDQLGVVIYPLSFVSEHVETLVELDIDHRQRAEAMGVQPFLRVPTVGIHPLFIAGLRDLVIAAAAGIIYSRTCPINCKCYREEKK
jgi:ferrochelatase